LTVLLRAAERLAGHKSRQAGAMKEPVYDLTPVLAVNEGPDYENKNYEEKTSVLWKT